MANISINLSPTRQCRSCRFNARSPYLICAVHPTGPKQRRCPDFESLTTQVQQPSSGSSQAPELEPAWMRFWGPPEDEWIAFWGSEELNDID